ncbi:UPF0481 protein At3g47200-like [Prosopis cineraria]|uniref:UPF0481 protein At3g47200-like n=1 Tax=Prosopis cineraria TaxID=364024 RepID=UPI00241015B6|nr:UPF0481 protein At3g47200-like [Prosopis cineraria]XP_054779672.1 UPF0481 protein At3g47200-like [Prosopis cineraria]XP_054779673.1 UPF0481 protein At3g47200-like [Prosopis cineraria]XP_054779674.1 UPF0481 protein At3g47200-like [Prosopis cineraria]XP_054779675.1 UPF0481 protein At3g47200-like [Prosopis cineraria]XP_054779677.1 UPF0481 protein At3g47200-like [Prosopis cineraria]
MGSHPNFSGSSNPNYEIVKDIIIDIKTKPEDPMNTTKNTIYRVPCNLRKLNKDAYTPQLVSIGPLHYGQKKLKPMQTHKLHYLDLFIKGRLKGKMEAMDKFKDFLKEKEQEIRQCYAEKLFCGQKLVDLVLLDSVFIMELFLRIQRKKEEEKGDDNDVVVPKQTCSSCCYINCDENNGAELTQTCLDDDDVILKQTWLNKNIQRDLLLLENQIPLFILEELYSSVVPDTDKKFGKFIEIAYNYFKCFHPYKQDLDHPEPSFGFELVKQNWKSDPVHFTDLIRYFYTCKEVTDRQKGLSSCVLRTATKLRESGVSFEKVTDRPLLDIKFDKVKILSWFLCLGCLPKSSYFKARLQIPQLKVDNTTECIFRNLIAFEQCHYSDQPCICNYVSLIDSLIHTKDDVELLVEKEVIVHELGSDKEVATLVNCLCKHVVASKTCYKKTIDNLNKHYQNEWYHTMASLRLVYFRDAWRASSTLVGIAVLAFTFFNFWRILTLVLHVDQR